MKNLFLVTLLFLNFSNDCICQEEVEDSFKIFLENYYEGGEAAFLEWFHSNEAK